MESVIGEQFSHQAALCAHDLEGHVISLWAKETRKEPSSVIIIIIIIFFAALKGQFAPKCIHKFSLVWAAKF